MVVSGRKVLEDEMHFILECPLYSIDRIELYDKLRIKPDINTTDSLMRHVMNPSSFAVLKYLVKFINKCDKKRKIKLSL